MHRRTLVTAGLWVIIRVGNQCNFGDFPMVWLIVFGSATSLIRGLMAIVDVDVKKIIAYRTLSQLGLITCSLGLKLYDVAFFHIVTHALFKALLFITAGTVMIMN